MPGTLPSAAAIAQLSDAEICARLLVRGVGS